MTVDQAIDIAWGLDKLQGEPRPTPERALETLREMLQATPHTWLGGQMAIETLERHLHPKRRN